MFKTSALLLVVCILFGSTSCQRQQVEDPNALKRIKIALNWVPEPEFGGFFAAKLQKFYEKRGLDVEIIVGGAGSPTVSMVAAKKVDFAVTSGNEVIVARTRDAKLKAVFAVYQKSPLMIMVHKSRKVKSLSEAMQKGTLAIERGGSMGTFLEKKFGFSKVKVVPYAGGIASFLHDPLFMQQGFATAENILAERQGSDPQVFLLADAGFNPYMVTLTTRDDLITQNPQVVKDVVEATREGWVHYLKHPQDTNKAMAEMNKSMDLSTFEAGAKEQMQYIEDKFTKKNKIGWMDEKRWKEQADLLLDLTIVDRIYPVADYFQNF